MSKSAEDLYREREQRFNDIVALRSPDRIPVIPLIDTYFSGLWKGMNQREIGLDHKRHFEAIRDATIEFGWDMAPPTGLFAIDGYEALQATQVKWPGGTGGLSENTGFQYVETEYLKRDEYDEFLADPDGFTLSKLWPRIAEKLEGFAEVPIPPLFTFSNIYHLLNGGTPLFGSPPIRKALTALLEAADAVGGYFDADIAVAQELAAMGYPRPHGGAPIVPPFDIIGDFHRGLKGVSMDMFRQPDKLKALTKLSADTQVEMMKGAIAATGNPRVFMPMHRGAGGFMSDAQFEEFYWPSFMQVIEATIEAGGVPCPLFEGDFTPRMRFLEQMPPGKVAAHFDVIDRQEFKKRLSDKMCFWGNVPASIMCTGSPEQVKADVKELCELFGDSGLLILDTGLGTPDEAKPENFYALREAADEYGVR